MAYHAAVVAVCRVVSAPVLALPITVVLCSTFLRPLLRCEPVAFTMFRVRSGLAGSRQPPISRDVRPGVCAICGATLGAISIALDDVAGTDAARRLWFARQAAVLVHVVDVVAIYEFATEVLPRAREAGLTALYEHVSRHDGSPAVLKTLDGWLKRWRKPKIEVLFSVLWQTLWPVARLFPRSVAEVVDPRPESSRSWANSC